MYVYEIRESGRFIAGVSSPVFLSLEDYGKIISEVYIGLFYSPPTDNEKPEMKYIGREKTRGMEE